MPAAERILIGGGMLLLVYAFATGFLLSRARSRTEVGPKYLVLAHTEPLMQGTLMLALVWAARLSTLPADLETLAAVLMVTAAALQGGKELLNWRQGVRDEFQERPLGWYAARTQAVMSSTGLVLFTIGTMRGLF